VHDAKASAFNPLFVLFEIVSLQQYHVAARAIAALKKATCCGTGLFRSDYFE
jgi:hypothetical protein